MIEMGLEEGKFTFNSANNLKKMFSRSNAKGGLKK
jgi:hypothetical protein